MRGRELLKIVTTIIRNYEITRQYEELLSVIRQEQAAEESQMVRRPAVTVQSANSPRHCLMNDIDKDMTVVE